MSNPTVEVRFELFDQITAGVKKIDESMGGFKASMGQLGNYIEEVGKKFFFMNQLAQGMQQFNQSVKDFSAPGADFQQQMADLSAITGIAGKDLDTLAESSRKLGKESGLGASSAAEAYKLLASNIDVAKIGISGLQDLQKNTITLTQSSGIDMATAANVMAGALNQYNLQASDAKRVTNVLGAGAKYGAAEVADLGESLKVAGATASNAGVSIEGTVGAIEILSQSMIKGAEAGTGLRNIILRLATKDIPGVDIKTQGLSGALQALKPRINDTAYLMNLFGMENVNAAQVLIKNADAVQEMTNKVTGTNTAYEQAAIRTNTYQYAVKRIKSQMDDFKISVFNATGSMLPWLEVLTSSVSGIAYMLPGLKIMKDGFFWLAGALKNGVIRLFEYIKGLSATTTAIQETTIVQRILNTVMESNPYVLVAMAAIALGVALYELSKKVDTVSEAYKTLKESQAAIFDENEKKKSTAKVLFDTARDLNKTYSDRVDALNQLKKIAPGYFDDFDTETIKTTAANKELTDYINNLDEAANKKAIFNQKVANKEAELKNAQENPFSLSNIWNGRFGFNGFTSGKDVEAEQLKQSDKFLDATANNLKAAYSGVLALQDPNGKSFQPAFSLPNVYVPGITGMEKDKFPRAIMGTGISGDTKTDKPPKKTLSSPKDGITEASGKASVKNIYINMDAALKIGTIQNNGTQTIEDFIKDMKTALNLALNDANYLAA